MLLGEARGRASLLPLLCGALLLLLLPAPAGAKNEAYAYDLLVGMGDGTGVGCEPQSSASSCLLASVPSSAIGKPAGHASHVVS